MSGASLPCCRVCGERIEVDRDFINGPLTEEQWACTKCWLCSYSFAYGHYTYQVGFCLWEWSSLIYDEKSWVQWRTEEVVRQYHQNNTEKETRTLWQTPEFAQWKWLLPFPVHTRPVDYGVLADWLEERGFPENVRGLRESLAGV